MSIAVSCPECGKSYNLADTQRGKTVVCRGCDSSFVCEDARPRRKRRDEEEEEERPARRRRDEEEEEDRPRRSRRDEDDDERGDPDRKPRRGARDEDEEER